MTNKWRTKKISGSKQKNRRRTIVKVLFLCIVFLLVYYVAAYMLPRVEVVLIPKSRDVKIDQDIYLVAKKNIDMENRVYLKGKEIIIEEEVENTFQVENEKNIGDRAEGNVWFFNYTGLSFDLFPEDELETAGGVSFVVREPLIIPPASVSENGEIVPGKIQAGIIAIEPGENGNIEPQKIFITSLPADKQLKIYAQSFEKLTGGTTKMAKVVAEDDIEKAREKLAEMLKNKVIQKANTLKADSEVVLSESFVLEDEEYQTEIQTGDEIEEFVMRLKAKGRVFAYKQEDLYNILKKEIDTMKYPQEVLIGDIPKDVTVENLRRDDTLGVYMVNVKAVWPVSNPLDIDGIKQQILGKKEPEARRIILSNPAIRDVIFIWDLAIRKAVPNIESHIKISVRQR